MDEVQLCIAQVDSCIAALGAMIESLDDMLHPNLPAPEDGWC